MRRSRLVRSLVPLAVVGVFAFAGGAALATGHTVKATSSNTWSPAKTTVSKGAKVTWSNSTWQDHDVVAYGGNWSMNTTLAHSDTTSHTFTKAGTFKFRCTFHSHISGGVCHGMCGRVVVG
jgi:plastocyanin